MSVGKTWVSPADFAGCDTFEHNQPDAQRWSISASHADGWDASADGMSDWVVLLAFLCAMVVPFAFVAWVMA